MAAPTDATGFTYRAFISYSHADQGWARWLIRKLEGYRIPRDLAGKDGDRRLGTIFRDRDEAAAADDLATAIRSALATSEHLIVVASPASARSAYVEREIREFAAINRTRARPGRILTLIADGEPNADDPQRECLPAALRGGLAAEDGAPVEPLAADARPTGDGKTRALAKLVAGMLGVRYDALVRRDLQRRRRLHAAIAATVCVAALIASGVAWKFEADRREREQLAQARAQAESERRTVAAVSNAERAKVLLAAGNVEGAVKLAGASLPDDGTLPFIPQAYATLYDTYINSGVPIDLEVLDMPADDSFTTPLSDGTWLSWTTLGAVKIWSPTRGISYATKLDPEPSRRPSATPAGDAVFVPDLLGLSRYRVAARHWDTINMAGLVGHAPDERSVLAIDPDTLIVCEGAYLMELALPATGDGAPEVKWKVPLGTKGCLRLARNDRAIFATQVDGGIVEFDAATHEPVHRYQVDSTLVTNIAVRGDRLDAHMIGESLIFHIGTDDPPLKVPARDASTLSPDGRFAVGREQGQFTIFELATGRTKTVDCFICRVIGFDGDDIIMLEHQKIVRRHLSDGKQTALLYQFGQTVDAALYFPGRNDVIGLRELRPETIVRLAEQPKGILISPSGQPQGLTGAVYFVKDDTISLTEASFEGNHTVGRIVRATADGPRTVWQADISGTGPTGFATMWPLGHDLIFVDKGKSMDPTPFHGEIIDPFANETVFTGRLLAMPESNRKGYVVVEGEKGLTAIDLARRTASPVPDSAKPLEWRVAGDRLLIAASDKILIRDLAPSAKLRTIATLQPLGPTKALCVADDNDTAYVVTHDDKQGYIERWSIAKAKRTALTTLKASESPDVFATVFATITLGRPYRTRDVSCRTDSFAIDGPEHRVVWTVANDKPSLEPKRESPRPPPFDVRSSPALPSQADISAARVVVSGAVAGLRDQRDGHWLFTTPEQELQIASAALLKRHGWLAIGLKNGRLRVWDVAAPAAPLIDIAGHQEKHRRARSQPRRNQDTHRRQRRPGAAVAGLFGAGS